ncbi:MAG: hypothetical protein HQ511_11370 [Rhodospirillales bacterium]|nr:hypothetical protein [Rhodospirillales bacterium]
MTARPRKIPVLKIVVWSLVVGLTLALLDVSPRALLASIGGTAQDIFSVFVDLFQWALEYIFLGAVVVLPIWAIVWAWRYARNKTGG